MAFDWCHYGGMYLLVLAACCLLLAASRVETHVHTLSSVP